MDTALSLFYLPTAVALGALHAIEPGHAKTLTAAYLIGVKGTRRDAVLLGLAVATTHSFVVVLLSVVALGLGREAFTERATHWLQVGSAGTVILLGFWLLWRRLPRPRRRHHAPHQHHDHHDDQHHRQEDHDDQHDPHDDHDDQHAHHPEDEDEHARAHARNLPDYARRGERPTTLQILAFGAAGGLIPCPASITVMLLALSINQVSLGLLAVLGFSLGLALTLVGIGLAIVSGLNRLGSSGRLGWLSRHAPVISAAMVSLSGIFALLIAH